MKANARVFTTLTCLVPVCLCVLVLIILAQPRSWGMLVFVMVVLPIGLVVGAAFAVIAIWSKERRAGQIIGVVTLASAAIAVIGFQVRDAADEAAESREQMKRTWRGNC